MDKILQAREVYLNKDENHETKRLKKLFTLSHRICLQCLTDLFNQSKITLQIARGKICFFSIQAFFLIGFTQCKAEQKLRGMQLQQKNT